MQQYFEQFVGKRIRLQRKYLGISEAELLQFDYSTDQSKVKRFRIEILTAQCSKEKGRDKLNIIKLLLFRSFPIY